MDYYMGKLKAQYRGSNPLQHLQYNTMITSQVEELTWLDAEKLLEKNTHNRRVSFSHIQRYADDMKAGNWILNGEAIKIAEDGTILDGQQRLMALVLAKTTIETLVVRGLQNEVFTSLDCGRTRAGTDVLEIMGVKGASRCASIVRAFILCEAGLSPTDSRKSISPSHIAERYGSDSATFDTLRQTHGIIEPLLSSSIFGTFAYHVLAAGYSTNTIAKFVLEIAHGHETLSAIDSSPVRLRMFLSAAKVERRRLTPLNYLSVMIKSFNYWVAGISPKLSIGAVPEVIKP